MVKVKLLGQPRDAAGNHSIDIDAETVREALRRIAEAGVDERLLRGALISVNGGPPTGARGLRRRLYSDDEIAVLLPSAGG